MKTATPKTTKVFVFLFLIIIATPLILFALRIKIEPTKKNDRKISLNFKRNFPLREDLIKVNNHIKSNYLEANAFPEKIVEGLDGWKFVGDNYSNALSESKGFLIFTDEELILLEKNLKKRKAFFKTQGINYYIAVAPNKLSVYADKLPISNYGKTTKAKQFATLCKSLDINFIDLGNQFPDPNKELLYFKTDTHWNYTAGTYAFNEVYKHLSKRYKNHNLRDYNSSNLVENSEKLSIGDLNDMLLLDHTEESTVYSIKNPRVATPITNKLSLPADYVFKPSQYESRFTTNTNDLKIMVLNDSFFGYIKSYFVDNFGESVFLWEHTYRKDLIKSEKPDIFFHEIVERNLDRFLADLR